MPQLKCDQCRIRVEAPKPGVPFGGASCPECGATLDVAESLRAVVGYRAVRDGWADESDAGRAAQAVALPLFEPPR